MEVWEYNHWVAYFMLEKDEHDKGASKGKY
jgi:hypothetical protein